MESDNFGGINDRKISIFDVEISCIKAKEAMMQAIEFMKGDSVNTIELVSMESLMKEHENPEWKKRFQCRILSFREV